VRFRRGIINPFVSLGGSTTRATFSSPVDLANTGKKMLPPGVVV
jgi:hypothetical protein